jgi:hypothetical protein
MAENPGEPKLTLAEAQAVVETKTAPRVTSEAIKAKIKEARYYQDGTLTICVLEMQNGFKQIGKAAPADESNYDAAVGQRYAYDDAFRGLWHLEGYLLCSLLRGEVYAVEPEATIPDEDPSNG